MAADEVTGGPSTYRQQQVHEKIEDHEMRITGNERRWLMVKGAIVAVAALEGIPAAITEVGTLI